METKQYKTLGNSIRDSVFNIKEAPTMLPDETIEMLGLGEDDILSMENDDDADEELDEAIKRLARAWPDSMKKHAQQVASNFSLLDSLNEQINDYFGDNWKMSSDKVFVAELKKLLTKEIKEIR